MGGSSGGIVKAVQRYSSKIPSDANCVLILPDSGNRYLSTVYCDQWVMDNLGVLPEKNVVESRT